jgi:hypothetical protein
MSKITAIDDLKTKNWKVTFDQLSPYYADLQIGFTEDKPIVEFTDLKFGFTLSSDNETIDSKDYPPKNVRYIRSDQKYLITHRLKFTPDTEYQLFLWAENAKTYIEHTETFTTPIPTQPYPSWTWDGENWNAPVEYPDDGGNYEWSEDEQTWVEISE